MIIFLLHEYNKYDTRFDAASNEVGKCFELRGALKIRLCKEVSYMLGITPYPSMESDWLKDVFKQYFSKVDIHRNTLLEVCIFGDFVENTAFGNVMQRILRHIPIKQNVYEYAMLTDEFVNVQRRIINVLTFNIKDSIHNVFLLDFKCTITLNPYFQAR